MKKKDYSKILSADVYSKTQGAFALLTSNIEELITSDEWCSAYAEPEVLAEVKRKIIDTFQNLESILMSEDEHRTKKFEEIDAARDTILDMERSIQLYTMMMGRYGSMIMSRDIPEAIQASAKPGNADEIRFDLVIEDCIDFARGSEFFPDDEPSERMSEVISSFPIRMTKEKFFDYMQAALENSALDLDKASQLTFLDMQRVSFDPMADPHYGMYFPEFLEPLRNVYATINSDTWDRQKSEILLREMKPLTRTGYP